MLSTRIIPCLLLRNESLVKTVRFKKFGYIGDPVNTCRIFNELEVDELAFLDILASREKREPNFEILHEIANECFMPLSYGGGIRSLQTAERIFNIGFEKIILNTYPFENPSIITELAEAFGSQSVILSIDVKKNLWGKYQKGTSRLYTSAGVGHWFPFRLGCPPEAPIIILRKGNPSAKA